MNRDIVDRPALMLGDRDQVVLITAVARSHTVYKYASAEDGATIETPHGDDEAARSPPAGLAA